MSNETVIEEKKKYVNCINMENPTIWVLYLVQNVAMLPIFTMKLMKIMMNLKKTWILNAQNATENMIQFLMSTKFVDFVIM